MWSSVDPKSDDAPPSRPGAGFGPLILAAATILGIAAIIGIPIYNYSDARWRPQAEQFMDTFVDAGGEGQHDRFSQLNGLMEDVRDHLSGQYVVADLDVDQAVALVHEAAANAGYDSVCRETTYEHLEHRIDERAEYASDLRQCLLTEGNDGRGWVKVAVFDSEALFDIEAGHGLANYWP